MSEGMPEYRRSSTEAQYPCVEQGTTIQFQILWQGKPARAAFRYNPELDHAAVTAVVFTGGTTRDLWTVQAEDIRAVYDFENDKRVFQANEDKDGKLKEELVLLSPIRPLSDWLHKRVKRALAAKRTLM